MALIELEFHKKPVMKTLVLKGFFMIALLASWATPMHLKAQYETDGQITEKIGKILDRIDMGAFFQRRVFQ